MNYLYLNFDRVNNVVLIYLIVGVVMKSFFFIKKYKVLRSGDLWHSIIRGANLMASGLVPTIIDTFCIDKYFKLLYTNMFNMCKYYQFFCTIKVVN